jgi:general secretion pathway protein G
LQSARGMQAILDTPILARPRRARTFHHARGITLIEILVVLAIIALISSGIAIVAMKIWEQVKNDAAAKEIIELSKAAQMYQMRKGSCPKSPQDLLAVGLIDKTHADPWGSDYVFTCPGEHAELDIASAGKDRELGTEDDVVSWSTEQRSASE